ncbi:bifunctional glutamate N-acetyltransferase/amino-acid acetyltransferase ArgJ [Chloroflexota bacterium]
MLQPQIITLNDLQTTFEEVPGFMVAGVAAGLRKSRRRDMALIVNEQPGPAAGVFTTNLVKAAPVVLDQQHLAQNPDGIRAVVINSSNANACTGISGMQNAQTTAADVAETLGCNPQDVIVMSTGVIGVPLDMPKMTAGVKVLAENLGPCHWLEAAQAIMTTDTVTKLASIEVTTPTGTYTVAGIGKGSGMIAPNMATMLVTIVTDAAIDSVILQEVLSTANTTSFNQIVVDGDMSTNDTVVAMSSGVSGVTVQTHEELVAFTDAMTQVSQSLAKQMVMDGEGATKFVTLHVTGAVDAASARQVAMSIGKSPLVKTAFYGSDANWGRILAAAGYAGVPLDVDKLTLSFATGEQVWTETTDLTLIQDGQVADYQEADAAAIMAHRSISVRLELGLGEAVSTVWTCDLSHDYVTINGDYRT